MTSRPTIPLPEAPRLAEPVSFWGKKPPKDALVRCEATPRVAEDATSATIRLYGPISRYGGYWGTSAKEVAQALDELPDTVTTILVRVNSPGGDCFEGLAILNQFRAHAAKIVAVVDGLAASAASFVVAGADERVMSPGTELMIHDPWSSAWACNAAEMRKEASVLDKIATAMAELYDDSTSDDAGDAAFWREVMVEETWYTAKEAVEAGLADRVEVVQNVGPATTVGDDETDLVDDEVFDLASLFTHAGRANAPAPAAAARRRPPEPPSASAVGSPHHPEGAAVVDFNDEQITALRAQVGFAEDADAATIVAAVAEALTEAADDTPSTGTTPAAALPEGTVVIEAGVLAGLREAAAQGAQARQQQLTEHRDRTIAAALADGRIAPARREHWEASWAADPAGAEQTLASLAPGLVPVAELGHADPTVVAENIPAGADTFLSQLGLTPEALK